jgi:hypothetical protein
MPSFRTPTLQQIEAAVQRMRSPEFAAYFLSRLNNPLWIAPLWERGVFASPPPIAMVEGEHIHYSRWPASGYLARMAKPAPKEVADILVSLETDNPSIFADILDAATKMPPAIAVTLVPTVCRAIKAGGLSLRFPGAIDFCVQLATAEETDAGMTLAEALFTPQFEPGQEEPAHRDKYWYMKGLKRLVPLLVAKAPNRFILDLCDWLTASIAAKTHTDRDSGSDYSDVWRPAIEEHEQNRTYDFAGEMVGLVRQAFEQAIGAGHLSFDAALAMIDNRRYLVFKRLRVHLINWYAEKVPELARSVMMDRSLFDDDQFKHEYAMLVGRRFSMLLPDEQQKWFGWIDAGPDMSRFGELLQVIAGRVPTDADRQARVRYWQFHRLHWIRDHLESGRRQLYQQMLTEHEDTNLADFNTYHGFVHRGYESPFTAEELNALSFVDVVNKVSEWRPKSGQVYLDGPQVEGAAATFGGYVSGKAEEFSAQAEILKGRPPIYVRTFIEKITEAVKAGREVNLDAVLGLCAWVIEQPLAKDGPMGEQLGMLVDRDWQRAREVICRLIREVCGASSEKVPRYSLRDHQNAIGALLEHLGHDPAKSHVVDDAERENPRVYDYLTSAINSPRGNAVDALLAYARWIANQTQQESEARQIVPDGFDGMPEVRAMLEWQIARENGSFEAFALIGAYLGLLCWIDKSWVERNAPQIFDLSQIEREPTRAHGWAAWNSFLVWGEPHVSYYQMLRPQYAYAVEHVSVAVLPPNAGRTPMHHLGEQLVVLYGRGDLAANGDEQLLFRFLQAAPGDVRSQTISFVGHSLGGDEKVPDPVVERFQKLWDWYWPEWGQRDAQERPQSGLFGSWFTCNQFPVEWCLDRLDRLLASLPIPEYAEQIVEHLAEIADTHIEVAARILDRMIRADKEGWRAYEWREPARKILESALRGDQPIRTMATQLIDYLGRRGYVEFGELLHACPR